MGIWNGTDRPDIEGGPCFRGGVSIIPEWKLFNAVSPFMGDEPGTNDCVVS